MPLIITTKRLSRAGEPPGFKDTRRRAVATLEEAREAARSVVVDHGALELQWNTALIPETGGTISLTDGTVIEVKLADDATLRAACPLIFSSDWIRMSDQEKCDAYNAKEN